MTTTFMPTMSVCKLLTTTVFHTQYSSIKETFWHLIFILFFFTRCVFTSKQQHFSFPEFRIKRRNMMPSFSFSPRIFNFIFVKQHINLPKQQCGEEKQIMWEKNNQTKKPKNARCPFNQLTVPRQTLG